MKLNFSGRGLAFLAHFKATSDIRYYLNGVYLAPMPAEAGGGVIGAASNGHAMGMWYDKNGRIDRPVIAHITPPLAKACGKHHDALLVNLDGRLAAVRAIERNDTTHASVPELEELFVQPNPARIPTDGAEAWEVLGQFPNVARVVPVIPSTNPSPRAPMGIGAQYLALFAKASPGGLRGGYSCVALNQAHPDTGILITYPATPEAIGVVMPMHMRIEEGLQPAWVNSMKRANGQPTADSLGPGQGMPSDAEPPQ